MMIGETLRIILEWFYNPHFRISASLFFSYVCVLHLAGENLAIHLQGRGSNKNILKGNNYCPRKRVMYIVEYVLCIMVGWSQGQLTFADAKLGPVFKSLHTQEWCSQNPLSSSGFTSFIAEFLGKPHSSRCDYCE